MSKVYRGSVFGIRELTEEQRAATRKELGWLEKDLIRRRKRLAYWTMRKTQADTMPEFPAHLREGTIHFYGRAQDLVKSGERLRAYLVAELQEQPEHQAAYHYQH